MYFTKIFIGDLLPFYYILKTFIEDFYFILKTYRTLLLYIENLRNLPYSLLFILRWIRVFHLSLSPFSFVSFLPSYLYLYSD